MTEGQPDPVLHAQRVLAEVAKNLEAEFGEASPFGALTMLPALLFEMARVGDPATLGDLCDHFVELTAWGLAMQQGDAMPPETQDLLREKGKRLVRAFVDAPVGEPG